MGIDVAELKVGLMFELTLEGNEKVDDFSFQDVWYAFWIRDDTFHKIRIKIQLDFADDC